MVVNRLALIQLVTPLSLNAVTDLNFGKLEIPKNNAGTITVSTSGTTSGTLTIIDDNNILPGIYFISGDENETIGISVQSDNNIPGLEISAFKARYADKEYENNTVGLLPPGESRALFVGATLHVDPSISRGKYNPSYTIEINYQ